MIGDAVLIEIHQFQPVAHGDDVYRLAVEVCRAWLSRCFDDTPERNTCSLCVADNADRYRLSTRQAPRTAIPALTGAVVGLIDVMVEILSNHRNVPS